MANKIPIEKPITLSYHEFVLSKIREYINAPQNKRVLGFLIVLVILSALPLIVIVSQQQQEIRQRASELISPPSPPFPTSPTPTPSGFCTPCSADINKDGKVNSSDLTLVRRCLNKSATYATGSYTCANRDINKDGIIDIIDMNCVARNHLKQCTQFSYPTPTPIRVSTPTPTKISTPTPRLSAYKRVFITSTTYNGNLGGLSGADAKCQERANAAKFGGTWEAWLSDITTSVVNRLTHANVPYKLAYYQFANNPDPIYNVADNWADLVDGTNLKNAIDYDEFGKNWANYLVWSNTDSSGYRDSRPILQGSSGHCNNWTLNSSSDVGRMGVATFKSPDWASDPIATYKPCSASFMHLYCFEQ